MTLRRDPASGGWEFEFEGEWRPVNDPDGLASPRQLRWLAARGLLELRDEPGASLTKLECAQAIDRHLEETPAA